MAHREGAPQDWTPNVFVKQRAHHNANKPQQAGRQIHPLIRDKDGNLQPHSPWMVHFILEDHRENHTRAGAHAPQLRRPHLKYAKSTYRLLADTKGTAYTLYTWAQYGDLPAPIWHPNPSWHQPLHGRRVPRQGIKPVGSSATGDPQTSSTPLSQTPACLSWTPDAPAQMTPSTAERRAPSEGPYTTTSTATKPTGWTRALSPSGLGGG